MSDEELIARLHLPWPKDESGDEVAIPLWVLELTTEAAECIKALNAKLDAADAKLAKAVELASLVVEFSDRALWKVAKEVVLELKGEK